MSYAENAVSDFSARAETIIASVGCHHPDTVDEKDRLAIAGVCIAMAIADVATSVEKLANNVSELQEAVRTDTPLQGQTFDSIASAISMLADSISGGGCSLAVSTEKIAHVIGERR